MSNFENMANDDNIWASYNDLDYGSHDIPYDLDITEKKPEPQPKPQQQSSTTTRQAKPKYQNDEVGMLNDKPIEFFIGKFGPCLKYDGKFYSVDKNMTLATMVSEEYAINVINKKNKGSQALVDYEAYVNGEKGQITVVEGPYGHYIKFLAVGRKPTKSDNYPLPKQIKSDLKKIQSLTKQELMEIMGL